MNYTLKVAKIRQETTDTVTLCLKQPGLKKIKYLAGQYLTLIFRINGRRYIRPYSFSSCPLVDEYLEITVKRVPNGVVSNHINDLVKEGDSIEVMPPMGDFIFKVGQEINSIYLWGVGSGITPLISIAKHVLFNESSTKVFLAYGNRDHESTILLDQIISLKRNYPDRFSVTHFHTNYVLRENNPYIIEGRIDKAKVLNLINPDQSLHTSAHYICGPAGLKESIKDALELRQVNPKNIYSEDFELIKDPKDFENIHTQVVEVEFKNETFVLEVVKGKSILEAALNANIELPYSCQTGSCNTCMGKIIKGELTMIGLSKARQDLNIDEYLLCCAHPLTENVKIKI